jgi:hypothetical protein
MKKAFFLLFLLFASFIFSIQLNVSVKDYTGTKLLNSNVSIYLGDTLIESKQTTLWKKWGEDEKALASFDLDSGIYFLKVSRSYYSEPIYLIELNSPKEIEVILLKNTSFYTLYGYLQNSSEFEGSNLYAIDEKGSKASSSKIYKNGYFLLNYLQPNKNYRLAILEPKQKFSNYFSYQEPGNYFLSISLSDPYQFEEQKIEIYGPSKVNAFEKITIFIKKGEKPLANQKVSVILPSNQTLELETDEYGSCSINAPIAGIYIFQYSNKTHTTEALEVKQIENKENETKTTEQKTEHKTELIKNISENLNEPPITAAQSFKPEKQVISSFQLVLFFILVLITSLILFVLFYIMFLRKKSR